MQKASSDRQQLMGSVPYPQAGGTLPRPQLSLVVPAYNEARRIGESLREMSNYLGAAGFAYEIIVVDDGSTDDTAAVVVEAAERDPHLRLVRYAANRGKGHAVRTGMLAAQGEYHVFIDADLSIPIETVPEMLAVMRGGYDIAVASRWHPDSRNVIPPPLLRRVMGSVFRWCVHRLVYTAVRDTQCGCKGYRADVSRRLFALSQIDRFSFDAEVIFLAGRLGYRIAEVPFALRHVGGSSVRPVRDSLLMLRDLLRIRANATRGGYGRLAVPKRAEQVL